MQRISICGGNNRVLLLSANVRKWEASVKNDEKELEKVKNDESRHMKVRIFFRKKMQLSVSFPFKT
jgi:hypothetical protein